MLINIDLINKFISSVDWNSPDLHTFSDEIPDYVEKNIDYNLFSLESGSTKLCVYPLDSKIDFVIKLPYQVLNGFYPITHAPLPITCDNSWNYCETELEYYELAQDKQLSKFFPKTIRYPANQYPIYLQEKCISYYQKYHDSLINTTPKEIKDLINSAPLQYQNWISSFCPQWLQDTIKYHGLKKVYKLFDFLESYNITDFHSDNYGYSTIDNRPVLIDFSGFYEEDI